MSAYLDITDKQMKALIKEHIDNMQTPEEMNSLLKMVVKEAAEWESYTDVIDWKYVHKKATKALKENDNYDQEEEDIISSADSKKMKALESGSFGKSLGLALRERNQ